MSKNKKNTIKVIRENLIDLQASHQVLLFLSLFSAIFYLLYLLDFRNVSNWFLYSILLFIEAYIILQTVGIWWTIFYSSKNPKDHHYYDAKLELIKNTNIEGGIDVFVTIYGESLKDVYNTLKASAELKIEHRTYALDDGNSVQVRMIAKSLGVEYISREKNTDNKAGNINNALALTKGKYFAVFDADHTPKNNFLIETVPFFSDENVAFVQTPQVMKEEKDMFSIGSADSQKIFYDLVGRGKNRFNSMFWVGTNAIFKRSAVEEVGNIFPHTSEDILTSYRLHQKNYKSVYIPDVLAQGLAPNTMTSYMKQQLRWAGGGFHMFFKENPLFTKMSLDQKIQYFLTSVFYYSGFVILFMILMPLAYIYFGIKPINANTFQWLVSYVPYFLFQFVMILILSGRFSWQSYIISINSFPAYILSFWKVITNQKISWNVSTGAMKDNDSQLFFLWPQIILLILSVLAIPLAIIDPREIGTTIFSLFWIIVNIISMGIFVIIAYKTKEIKQ